MSEVERVRIYLRRLTRRFRVLAAVRGVLAFTMTALLLSVGLASYLTANAASPTALLYCRLALAAGLAAAAVGAIWIPVRRWRLADVVTYVERQWPPFDSRLRTLANLLPGVGGSPFVPLLADEVVAAAPPQPIRQFVPARRLVGFAIASCVPAAALAYSLTAARGPFGHWVQALWGVREPFRVELSASRHTVARGRSIEVVTRVNGFSPGAAELWVRAADTRRWRRAPLHPDGDGVFRAAIGELAADAEFYASAEGVRSARVAVRTVDLPLVKNVEWSSAGDGEIELTVDTDRPMRGGELVSSSGNTRPLPDTRDNRTRSAIAPGEGRQYYVGVRHGGELVPVSDEFEVGRLERWGAAPGREVPPQAYGGSGRLPPGYEEAVREYYRLLSRRAR